MPIINDLLGTPARPYIATAKIVAFFVTALAIGSLLWSWLDRGRQIDALAATQTTIVEAATVATVKPGDDGQRELLTPEQVPAAIAALSNSLRSADESLRGISGQTMTAKRAAEVADRALNRDLEEMRREAAGRDLDEWDPWQ